MKRRYLIVAGSLAAMVCLTLAVLAMLPADPVTPKNCELIVAGMTLAEVEAIFGRPADQTAPQAFVDTDGLYREPFTVHYWFGGVGVAYFTFDADGKLVYGGFSTARPSSLYRRAAKQVGLPVAPVPEMKLAPKKGIEPGWNVQPPE